MAVAGLSKLRLNHERRSRLAGAILGAQGNEWVTVRAADLHACLALADAAHDALEVLGENEVLKRTIIERAAEAEKVQPLLEEVARLKIRAASAERVGILEDQLATAHARAGMLANRIANARQLLAGER